MPLCGIQHGFASLGDRLVTRIHACLLVIVLGAPLTACADVRIPQINSPDATFDTVNGSIRIGADSVVGDLETVNGSVSLGSSSRGGTLETVNGGIDLGDRVRIESAETVNGDIVAGAELICSGDLETVNGDVRLGRGAEVGEDIATVNGRIVLDRATVRGALGIVAGEIDTGRGSNIGAINVHASRGTKTPKGKPRVIVGADSVVGPIVFERDGELRIHRSARVGTISGVEPAYFD
jgi:hypothetical protein